MFAALFPRMETLGFSVNSDNHSLAYTLFNLLL